MVGVASGVPVRKAEQPSCDPRRGQRRGQVRRRRRDPTRKATSLPRSPFRLLHLHCRFSVV